MAKALDEVVVENRCGIISKLIPAYAMNLQQTTLLVNSDAKLLPPVSPRDLVMAWAVDCDTNEPRYILQLDAAHRGKKSNCKCPSCGLPLLAVNAAKREWRKRPHFRHPEGTARERCVIIAARKALEAMLGEQELITLPRRRRSRNVEGLSGQYFDAWVERPPEHVRLADCKFCDEATAILTLDDGRRLAVRLAGRGGVSDLDGEDALLAQIEINIDDPAIAGMSPEEIFARLELSWSVACWLHHWEDTELDHEAETKARQNAANALDWLDDADIPEGLSPIERRETLLHREVKSILEHERRIRLPGLDVEAKWRRENGSIDKRMWSKPEAEIALTSVKLEVPLGCAVPDVLAEWIDDIGWSRTMLIEVTVTNPITNERIERISSFGWPALEIDIGRMGGVVTREELTRLVVDEIAGKRWLYHPSMQVEKAHLIGMMKREAEQVAEINRRRQVLDETPPDEWARRYLDAFRRRWSEQLKVDEGGERDAMIKAQNAVSEVIEAFEVHGYANASDIERKPLRTIVARILSIQCGTGIEYKYGDAWGVINAIQCDQNPQMRWHTLYLIALHNYQPTLTSSQQEKVSAWRKKVTTSIKSGEKTYVRDTLYDRLLGLLFPELRTALMNSFGTARSHTEERSAPAVAPKDSPAPVSKPGDLFLRGREFEEWARRNPEAAVAWLASPAGKKST